MALRVFVDRDGHEWQVWNVNPSFGRKGVRIQFRDGWLCFERVDGEERARLSMSDVPPGWEQLPDERLELLRRMAVTAARPSARRITGEQTVIDDEEAARQRTSGPRQVLGPDDSL